MSAAISRDIQDRQLEKNTNNNIEVNKLAVKDDQKLDNKQKALLQTINKLVAIGKTND